MIVLRSTYNDKELCSVSDIYTSMSDTLLFSQVEGGANDRVYVLRCDGCATLSACLLFPPVPCSVGRITVLASRETLLVFFRMGCGVPTWGRGLLGGGRKGMELIEAVDGADAGVKEEKTHELLVVVVVVATELTLPLGLSVPSSYSYMTLSKFFFFYCVYT